MRSVGRQLAAPGRAGLRRLASRWRAWVWPLPQQTPAPQASQRARALFEELEPRLLYSADNPAAWLSSAVLPAVAAPEVQVVPAATVLATTATPPTPTVVATPHELVFIDAGVVHTQALIDGLLAARPAGTRLDFVALQAGSDGLRQISDELALRTNLAAVHIVAHGEQAALQLGSLRLDAAALQSRAAELQAWRAALTDDADLLLYGCDVAAGDSGAAFIESLARLTGADVAASTNATGASAAGGDWVLEAQVGAVTAQAAAVPQLMQALAGTLGLLPVGSEVRVNVDATGLQELSRYGGGNVAMDSAGNYVVAWNDPRTGSGDIYFQRYDVAGVAQGGNVLANTTTANTQGGVNIAMDPGTGNFVLVWESDLQDGSNRGVYGQRFDNAGVPLGGEFLVNTVTSGEQMKPAVAVAPGGAFVVAWTLDSGASPGIRAQRFNAAGVQQGGEIAVNTSTSSAQQYPSVAMAASGNFVVMWESDHVGDFNVYGQRFNATGVAQGGEFQANTYSAGTQWNVAVAADTAGNFVAVWESSWQDPGGNAGIYGQRFNASGVAQGGEFRVNTTTASAQTVPAISMDGSGNFVVSWNSNLQDGSGAGVYMQAFDAAGTAQGGEWRANTTTSGTQAHPAVALTSGRAVVVWEGNGSGDAQGVFAQLYLANEAPTLGNGTLAAVNEDAASPAGQSVSTVFTGQFADADSGSSFAGMAIVGNTANAGTQGAWQYSSNGGTHWFAVGTVADGATALAVSSSSLIRFVPVAHYNGTPTALTVRGLDDTYVAGFSTTAGSESRVMIDTTTNGGSTAIAAATATLSTSISAVNDAPVLGFTGLIGMTPTNEDTASAATLVSDILISALMTDVDAGALRGIAVTSVTANGTFQYSTNGVTWTNFGAVGASNALLLASSAQLRYVPDGANAESASFVFRGWDQTSGPASANGAPLYADPGAGGGTSAFSAQSATVVETVTAVNDAPVLLGVNNLASINRNPASNPGTRLADLVAEQLSDVDNGAVTGLAVKAVVDANGAWQYSTNSGGNWFAFGTPPFDNARLLLADASTFVRFVPNANWSGTVVNGLSLRGWDQSSGAVGSTADTSANGGSTAFSIAAHSASITVTESNTAPVLSGANNLSTINEDPAVNPGTLVSALIAGQVVDVDPGAASGIAVTAVDNTNGTWQYTLNGGGLWADFGTPSAAAARLLAADASTAVRFVPNANWNGAVAPGITFRAWDRTSGWAGATASVSSASSLVDNFTTAAYNNNAGSANWSTNWVESDDDGGGATGGNILVTGGALRVGPGSSGDSIYRQADLTGLGSATLSFDFSSALISGKPTIEARISADGGVTYSTLATFTKNLNTGSGSMSFDISAYASGSTRVQFLVSGNAGGAIYLSLDNVQINASASGGSTAFSVATASASITVNPVNDAPVRAAGLAANLTVLEDAAATSLGLGALTYAPGGGSDEAAQTLTYTVTAVPSAVLGNVTLSDGLTVVTTSTSYSLAQLRGMQFVPAANANGGPATFSWNVVDSGGTVNGGVNTRAESLTVTVTPVNDAPVVSATGTTLAYTENDAASAVDAGLTVSDLDNANLASARVSISANFVAGEDVLAFTNQFGITGSWNMGTGVLTLTGSATVANYQSALRSISYLNSSDAPSTALRGVSFVVNDGLADSMVATRNVAVTAVNDAPAASGLNAAEIYTEDATLRLLPIGVSDVDHAAGSVTLTLSNPAAGTLSTGTSGAVSSAYNAGTGVWTASGALASVNALLSALDFTPATHFNGAFGIATSVSDGVAPPITGNKAFTGVAVNDAPTASNLSAAETYTEDVPLNLTDIVVSDVDSSSGSVTLTLSNPGAGQLNAGTSGAVSASFNPGTGVWTASGNWADVNNLLAALVFTPVPDFSGGFSIATSVSDGVAPPITGTKAFTGVPVNDAPSASNLSAAETYTEDLPLNLTDIVVGDIDSANITATLTLSNLAAGSLSTGTAGAVTSTFNAGSGAWSASGALADVNALLAGLVFTPAADFDAAFSIATSVSDGVAVPITGSKAFTGVPLNDAPIASNLSAAETYTEDVPLNLTDIVVSDVDSSSGSVTLTLSDPSVGLLGTGSSGAVSSSYNPATGVWTASGAWADINVLLAALSFTPTPDFNGAFSIATRVSDGVAAPVAGSKLFTGLPVNDTPTATGLNTAETYTEDTPLDLSPIVASDRDSSSGSAMLLLSNLNAGTLSTASAGASTSTFDAATGVWSASGSWADLNALLAQVRFVSAPDFNGAFSIATSVSDGLAAPVTGSKAFTGVAVNDAPVASGLNSPQTYTEDTPLDLADIVVSDVDSGNVTVTLVLSDVSAGRFSTGAVGTVNALYDAATGTWTASGALADVNTLLAGLRFTPALDFNGSFSVATQVSDGVAAPITGSQRFTGVAVNDPPLLAVNAGLLVAEGSTTTLSAAHLGASDVDNSAAELVYTLTTAPAHGWVLRAGAALAPGASFTQADLDAGRVAYQHDASETTSDAFSFTLDDGQAVAASAQLLIAVTPVNDEIPRVTSPLAGAVVPVAENTRTVATVTASDADLPAQTLRFQLSGGADAAFFSIDANTGELQFIAAPDYEKPLDADADNLYQFNVRVDDGELSSLQSITVAVTPVNDNAPQIISSSGGATGGAAVQEGRVTVVTVAAVDADQPKQALAYSIAGGVDAALFGIDPTSGALRFVNAPMAVDPRDSNRDNLYEVVVQASDGSFTVQQALRVQVRAALAPGQPSTPPSNETPLAPAPYAGSKAPADGAAAAPLVWQDLPPASTQEAEEAVSWALARQGRRTSVLGLADGAGSRNDDWAEPATLAQQLAAAAADAANAVEAWLPGPDTQSLEAALGLPSMDPDMLQVRPGGLSLAALAAQAAARSSTAVPGQLSPSLPMGDEGRADGDSDSMVEALATPVVAGGLAFSATLLIWATRAGGLMAAMMASAPAWRALDPLPILERSNKPDDDELTDDFPALTGAEPSATPPNREGDAAAGGAPPAPGPWPGTQRELIEPLEMLR